MFYVYKCPYCKQDQRQLGRMPIDDYEVMDDVKCPGCKHRLSLEVDVTVEVTPRCIPSDCEYQPQPTPWAQRCRRCKRVKMDAGAIERIRAEQKPQEQPHA